jgi:hypothetical protein
MVDFESSILKNSKEMISRIENPADYGFLILESSDF